MKSLLPTTLRSLLDDIQRLQPDVKGLDRDLLTIEARFEDEGYGFLTIALPSLGKAFDKGLDEGWLSCPTGFKKVPRGSIPAFLSGLTENVFDSKTGQIKEVPDVSSIVSFRQVTYLLKKLQLSFEQEETLDHKAKSGFFLVIRLSSPLQGIRLTFTSVWQDGRFMAWTAMNDYPVNTAQAQ